MEAAKYDLEGGHILAAANRSYYAMFYCMTALLYTKEVVAKIHQGVQSKFNELFIKTGLIEMYVGKYVQQAFTLRQNADYDLNASIESAQIKDMLDNAIDFYQHTKQYLEEI